MKYEVTAEYTEALVKTSTRHFIRKFLGWDYLAVWQVMLAAVVALRALGQRGWLVGALGMFVIPFKRRTQMAGSLVLRPLSVVPTLCRRKSNSSPPTERRSYRTATLL